MVNKKTLKIGLKLIYIPFIIFFFLGLFAGSLLGMKSNLYGLVWLIILGLSPIGGLVMLTGGIVCIVALCQDNAQNKKTDDNEENHLTILKKNFAEGKITESVYLKKKKILEQE